jgi:hypothetical protein
MRRILGTLKQAKRVLLGRITAGRNASVYPDDVFLVSYPKSGNTWVRFLIANLISEEPITFLNIEQCIPSVYILPDRELRRVRRPRVLKSHECFMPRYRKVIYIVRDPRDVAVSYYHYNLKKRLLPPDCSIEQYAPLFIADELDMRCGPWGDHVMSWMNMRESRDKFLLLRYEDMQANTVAELRRVAEFFSIDPTPERLNRAVQFSSADRLRELEKKESKDWVFTKGMRQDIPFIRAAKSGGWQSALPPKVVAQIETAWGDTMERLGYELVTRAKGLSSRAKEAVFDSKG